MQKTNFIRQNVLPVLAALIWGTAFVAQSISAEYIETFTFNTARAFVAFWVLLIVRFIFKKIQKAPSEEAPSENTPPENTPPENTHYRRDLILAGVCCGGVLTLGAALQQAGLATTSPGKAGFITTLYIVIVPLVGLLFHKKVNATVWVGVAMAVAGLYFLCIQENVSITSGDFFIFLCAFAFAAHILVVDHFTQKVNALELSCVQQLVMGVFSAIGMLAYETPSWTAILHCAWPLLYMGVFSGGVAYTLQILAQKDANPTVVSLLLSLEALFATVAGALILHDRMSPREYLGCGLMLAAVVLAQVPQRSSRKVELVAEELLVEPKEAPVGELPE